MRCARGLAVRLRSKWRAALLRCPSALSLPLDTSYSLVKQLEPHTSSPALTSLALTSPLSPSPYLSLTSALSPLSLPGGYRLLRYVLHKVPSCLSFLCTALCNAIGGAYKCITAALAAISQCWSSVLDWLARHCKAALFAAHDLLVAPVLTSVDRLLLTPLSSAATACCLSLFEGVLKPLGKAIVNWLEVCLPGDSVFKPATPLSFRP